MGSAYQKFESCILENFFVENVRRNRSKLILIRISCENNVKILLENQKNQIIARKKKIKLFNAKGNLHQNLI